MGRTTRSTQLFFGLVLTALLNMVLVSAHCDRLDGPVAKAALSALESGRFQTIQIWVGAEHERELKRVFEEAIVVREQSRQAKQLADRYFVETAVRLHREAEGMPYTGVKPAGLPVPPDVQAADEAITNDDVEPLIRLLSSEIEKHVSDLFQEALHTKQGMDTRVEAGRRWVDSYVRYIVYTHGLYTAIQAGPEHGLRH